MKTPEEKKRETIARLIETLPNKIHWTGVEALLRLAYDAGRNSVSDSEQELK